MSYEIVDIYIKDSSPAKNPAEGVVVRAFSENGKIFYTQATTDVGGHAGFLLPSGLTFQLRFFKQNVGFVNPQYIVIAASPGVNSFDVTCDVLTPPTSRSARLCVAFGYFYRIDGSPAANVDIHVIAKFNPLLLDGNAILTEQLAVRTDEKGYVEMPLVRCGQYDVTVQGIEDYQRCISVPDAPNVNWPDLLFPVVDRVSFTPTPPTTLAVGQEVSITPSVYATDGNLLLGGAMGDVFWSSSDNSVLVILLAGGVITLRGIGPGTASLRAVRADQSIVRIPDLPIRGLPPAITVS